MLNSSLESDFDARRQATTSAPKYAPIAVLSSKENLGLTLLSISSHAIKTQWSGFKIAWPILQSGAAIEPSPTFAQSAARQSLIRESAQH